MGKLWANEGRTPTAFASLPPAANNTGRQMLVTPLVAGQNYFFVVSDGTYWRPMTGDQVLYSLAAPIDMAVNGNAQKLVSIPLPAGLLADGRSSIEVVMGWDKLLGVSDTLTMSTYIGTNDSTADQLAFAQQQLVTNNISLGVKHRFGRITATTVRRYGANSANAPFSATSTSARGAAVTVGNMDSVINYLGFYGQMTTGATEKGELHALTVRLLG